MTNTKLEVNVTALWKRLAVVVLLGAVLVWVLPRVWAQVRGLQMANVVGDADKLKPALAYDPGQADVHTRLGFHYLYDPFFFDPAQAAHHFEAAVRIHPWDWQAWSNLGSAYEQQPHRDRAERAYLTGIELAPHYSYPRWTYANFLLRQGELEKAVGEFRRVAEIEPPLTSDICELMWRATGDRAAILAQFATTLRSDHAKARVGQYLMARGEYQHAVDVWKTLADGGSAKIESARLLVPSLSQAGQWPLARLVWQELVRQEVKGKGEPSPADLAFWNRDLERDPSGQPFDWTLTPTEEVEVEFDRWEKHTGQRSLLLEFKRHQKVNFSGVTHYLWVEPSTRYRLRFYYKTEGVPETNGLAVVMSDGEAPARLTVESEPLGSENQWTRREMLFETGPQTRVVRLDVVRRPVGQIYDYVTGRVWLDSFSLEPVPME